MRIGIIGLDSSHAVAFSEAINASPSRPGIEGARVVAAFPAGSPDLPVSADRIAGFTQSVIEQGVHIVQSIEELLSLVDVVMINSVDGRVHLEQARAVIEAGKPVFVDKPFANSVQVASEIFTLAKEKGVPCFTSSSLRFHSETVQVRMNSSVGSIVGCHTYSPCAVQAHHPNLFWYGIHGAETLFTLMGTGCRSVSCTRTEGADVVVGRWNDGRIGSFRGIRDGKHGFGAVVFGSEGIASVPMSISYEPLVVEILQFFRSGKPPVSAAETLEILMFLEAANESHRRNGAPVMLEDFGTTSHAV